MESTSYESTVAALRREREAHAATKAELSQIASEAATIGEAWGNAKFELATLRIRAAQWEAIFRRDWNLGECQPGVYEVWRLWKNPGDTISTGPTEQAAIDAAFERYPLGESKSGA